MSKVFARHENFVYFIDGNFRGRVVQVDLGARGYPETAISFAQSDLFQIAEDGAGLLLALGEESGYLTAYNLTSGRFQRATQLASGTPSSPGGFYRTLASLQGLTVVSAVRNSGYSTENTVHLIDSRLAVVDSVVIGLDGGNFGLYMHKIVIGRAADSGTAVVGLVSHHSAQAHLYIFAVDEERRKLHLLKKVERLSSSSLR